MITDNVLNGDATQKGITGEIVTCPKYESDGKTLSPIAGQAVVANLMPGRYGVVATPAADRIARGEEWLQTNTLDGQKAHDSFLRVGEPSFFQEYGPAGYHVIDRLRQSADHQGPAAVRLQRYRRQHHRRELREYGHGAGDDRADEPHAG